MRQITWCISALVFCHLCLTVTKFACWVTDFLCELSWFHILCGPQCKSSLLSTIASSLSESCVGHLLRERLPRIHRMDPQAFSKEHPWFCGLGWLFFFFWFLLFFDIAFFFSERDCLLCAICDTWLRAWKPVVRFPVAIQYRLFAHGTERKTGVAKLDPWSNT